jgi:hypothetical protein
MPQGVYKASPVGLCRHRAQIQGQANLLVYRLCTGSRFNGVPPVVQPGGADQAAVTMGNSHGEIGGITFSDLAPRAEVQPLRDACD